MTLIREVFGQYEGGLAVLRYLSDKRNIGLVLQVRTYFHPDRLQCDTTVGVYRKILLPEFRRLGCGTSFHIKVFDGLRGVLITQGGGGRIFNGYSNLKHISVVIRFTE